MMRPAQLRQVTSRWSRRCASSRVLAARSSYRFFASSDSSTTISSDLAGLSKNPIVQQLWKARDLAKKRDGRIDTAQSTTNGTQGKPPSESRVEVHYPFSTDVLMREAYRNPWGQMRHGKLMEDLDALAGNIAFFHVDEGQAELPVIVTASFDRIKLRERPKATSDQHLSGQVTWTGTSSMEIRMQCFENTNSLPWLEAYVTFVTLDPHTKKPIKIPPLVPVSNEEKAEFEAGAERAARKKARRKQSSSAALDGELDALSKSLLAEAGPLLNMPSLADPHSILIQATSMQNAMIAQPQGQNLHSRIFGGFLMRRAFELAFANAYVFGGARPIFLEVDEVSFASPVDVGDLLVFNSRVLYTDKACLQDWFHDSTDDNELPLVHIEVEAWVTEPENVTARLSNQFYFTYAVQSDKPVRKVLPSNIDEARRMATRILGDREQHEVDK